MGIQGLIPFMEKSSRQVNIKQYAGCSVAVDAYCWLHKGAFSCAEKLARGESTNAYVLYCMKFVNMLLASNVTPILVFDGRHLPAKASTEQKRRESRDMCRKQAAELLRAGRVDKGRSFLRRCIDVTHEMALALMKECRRVGVDCIVAPYEADAQLAYLNLKGMAQLVITEDSDLVLFGCSRILFKMDLNGNGLLVEQERLFMAMRVRPEGFCFDKFRYMCILSGCDYLASLPGIGLSKACKFVKKTAETDIHKALVKLPSYLNMNHLTVTQQYRDDFVRAVETFRYQLVFDPGSRKLVPLTDPPDTYLRHPSAGEMLADDVALQLALGNLDPFTLRRVDNFDPDVYQMFSGKRQQHSIWSRDYKTKAPVPAISDPAGVDRPSTRKKVVTVQLDLHAKQQEVQVDRSVDDVDLTAMYGDGKAADKTPGKRCHEEIEEEALVSPERSSCSEEPLCKHPRQSSESSPPRSPVLEGRVYRNPFATQDASVLDRLAGQEKSETSPSLLARLGTKFGALCKFSHPCSSSTSTGIVVHSRYFVTSVESSTSSNEKRNCSEETITADVLEIGHQRHSTSFLKDVSNVAEQERSSLCKPFEKTSPHKQLPLQNAEVKNNQSPLKLKLTRCSDKHRTIENRSPSRSLKSFKWDDFQKRFSFEANQNMQCSVSTSQAFKNPCKEDISSSCESLSPQDVVALQHSNNLSEGSISTDSGCVSDSPRSQCEKTSDALQHSGNSSKTNNCRRPGLKKPVKQQNLLNMFGFQKKHKLASS